jgi:hypothetical protein
MHPAQFFRKVSAVIDRRYNGREGIPLAVLAPALGTAPATAALRAARKAVRRT